MGKKISRRSFIKKSIATAAMTGMSSILLTQQAPANVILNRKPNILFILNDQERAWPFIQKNVNLPARRYLESISTYFNRSYTSTPICSPARSSIYTGQHIQFTGVYDNTVAPWVPGLYDNINTIGHLLSEVNYETGYFGKWHLTNITENQVNENSLGFDGMKAMLSKHGFKNSNQEGEKDLGQGGYLHDGPTANITSEFINDKKDNQKPWAAFVNFVNPHDIMFYRVDPSISGTGFLGDHQKFAPADEIYDLQHEIAFPKNFGIPSDEDWSPMDMMNTIYGEIPFERIDLWKKFINYYYNCLRDVDRHINTLVENLKSSNQLDNTIIFMVSDHGEMLGQHGMRGKIAAWEESVRVPTLIYHPDLKKQQNCDSVVSNIDFVPTMLEFAGLDQSQIQTNYPELKGKSFAPITENVDYKNYRDDEGHLIQGSPIIGAAFDVNEKVRNVGLADNYYDKFKAFATKGNFLPDFSPPFNYKAIVTKKYKFVRGFSPRQNNIPTNLHELLVNNTNIQLYDLEKDPYELNNMANDQSQNELLLKMNAKLNVLMDKEVGLENHVTHLPGPDWFWTT